MSADPRTTEIANTLAKLAALMAEQNSSDSKTREKNAPRESPDRLLLTVEEAANLLNLGRTKTYSLVRSGEIESVQIGRLRRVPKSAIDDYTERLISAQSNDQRAA